VGLFEDLTDDEMQLGEPTRREAIDAAERAIGKTLPEEYVMFLLEHNGADGPVGEEGWAVFYPAEELAAVNADYGELDHLTGWFIFGGNGAGEAYAFDEHGEVFVVPHIGGREDAIRQGRFEPFLRRLADGTMFNRLD
jgi:hypothetical protein